MPNAPFAQWTCTRRAAARLWCGATAVGKGREGSPGSQRLQIVAPSRDEMTASSRRRRWCHRREAAPTALQMDGKFPGSASGEPPPAGRCPLSKKSAIYATSLPRDRAKASPLTYDATRCLWLPTERAPTRLHTRKLMGAALVIAANRLDAAPAARGPSSRRSSGQLTSSYLRSDSRSREYARGGVGEGAARTGSARVGHGRARISFELHD